VNEGATEAPDVSIVLACYNEAAHIEESVRQILSILAASAFTTELVFVDDASTDDTRVRLQWILGEYQERLPIRVVHHRCNTGRGRTVSDGMRLARGGIIGYLDIDLEVHARYVPALVRAVQEGADVVVARRVYRIAPSPVFLVRHLLSVGYRWLVNRTLRLGDLDTEAGCKFFRREPLLELLPLCQDPGWFWDTELMAHARRRGLAIVEVPCLFARRADKRSTLKIVPATFDYLQKLMRFRRGW
jgi:glycosyltransferase involved in cell wall biosynthesis